MIGPSDVERHTARPECPARALATEFLHLHRCNQPAGHMDDPAEDAWDEHRCGCGARWGLSEPVAAHPAPPEPDDREALAEAWDEGYDARREFCRQGHRSDLSCNPYHRAPAEPVRRRSACRRASPRVRAAGPGRLLMPAPTGGDPMTDDTQAQRLADAPGCKACGIAAIHHESGGPHEWEDPRPLAHLMAGPRINACGHPCTPASDTGNLWRVNCEGCLSVVWRVRQSLSTRVSIDVPAMASRVLVEPSRVEAILLALERAGVAKQIDANRWLKERA